MHDILIFMSLNYFQVISERGPFERTKNKLMQAKRTYISVLKYSPSFFLRHTEHTNIVKFFASFITFDNNC